MKHLSVREHNNMKQVQQGRKLITEGRFVQLVDSKLQWSLQHGVAARRAARSRGGGWIISVCWFVLCLSAQAAFSQLGKSPWLSCWSVLWFLWEDSSRLASLSFRVTGMYLGRSGGVISVVGSIHTRVLRPRCSSLLLQVQTLWHLLF